MEQLDFERENPIFDVLRRGFGNAQNTQRVLVVSQRGDFGFNETEQVATREQPFPIYYLAGGARAYSDYFTQQVAMQKRRAITIVNARPGRFTHSASTVQRSGGCCGGR